MGNLENVPNVVHHFRANTVAGQHHYRASASVLAVWNL